MNSAKRTIGFGRVAIALAAALGIAFTAYDASADKMTLKDGRVLEGKVEKQTDDYVWFVVMIGGLEHRDLYDMKLVKSIELEARPADEATPVEDEDDPMPVFSDDATRVAFITLEDTVGTHLNADALLRSVELIEEGPDNQQPDIIVLQINSGGGALAEVQPLIDAIHKDLKKDYRVVGWIESAISAASLTIFNCEEIYMMDEGNVGGTVAYMQTNSGTKAVEGEELEQLVDLGAQICENGNLNPLIMEAMQRYMTLSCDVEEDGDVIWYDNDQGEFMVSKEGEILTLNSVDAEKYAVSMGTVNSKDELAEALGLAEWVEVGHIGDEYQVEFRENVSAAQVKLNTLGRKYSDALERAARARSEKQFSQQVGKARKYLREIKSLVRKAPSLERYMGLTKDWFRDQEEAIEDMVRKKKEGVTRSRGGGR